MLPATSALYKARQHDHLWPPVFDAVDTYIRRRASRAHGYERVWRLIHIWEAIEITLASVAIARIAYAAEQPNGDNNHVVATRKCRELCYGLSWNTEERCFKTQQGAFDGSIDRWIDILWHAARLDSPVGYFIPILKNFLNSEVINATSFHEVWRNACDVPIKADSNSISIKECIRQVNTFRNRFAHVPFPPLPIERVADALEQLTDQLFNSRAESDDPEPWNTRGVLTGAIIDDCRFLRGGGRAPIPPTGIEATDTSFAFAHDQRAREYEVWKAIPFAYMDASLNGYILTRLKGQDQGTWEFTRFRAETSPVITLDKPEWIARFKPPSLEDYEMPASVGGDFVSDSAVAESPESTSGISPTEITSLSDAIGAMRRAEFEGAARYLQGLVSVRPTYHVGWLKLGIAKREMAARMDNDRSDESLKLMNESVEDLTKATEHIDPEYQASAYYERSKAQLRMSRLVADESKFESALEDATNAARISSDERYVSWVDYLERTHQQSHNRFVTS